MTPLTSAYIPQSYGVSERNAWLLASMQRRAVADNITPLCGLAFDASTPDRVLLSEPDETSAGPCETSRACAPCPDVPIPPNPSAFSATRFAPGRGVPQFTT